MLQFVFFSASLDEEGVGRHASSGGIFGFSVPPRVYSVAVQQPPEWSEKDTILLNETNSTTHFSSLASMENIRLYG